MTNIKVLCEETISVTDLTETDKKVMRRLEKKKLIKIFPSKQGFTFKLLKK